jgi:hypothetical protein
LFTERHVQHALSAWVLPAMEHDGEDDPRRRPSNCGTWVLAINVQFNELAGDLLGLTTRRGDDPRDIYAHLARTAGQALMALAALSDTMSELPPQAGRRRTAEFLEATLGDAALSGGRRNWGEEIVELVELFAEAAHLVRVLEGIAEGDDAALSEVDGDEPEVHVQQLLQEAIFKIAQSCTCAMANRRRTPAARAAWWSCLRAADASQCRPAVGP